MQFVETMYIQELDETIEVPKGWSYNAVRIFADKYLAPQDCNSILMAICRVADTVAQGDLQLANRIAGGLSGQRFSFNSPVWFNAGVEEEPQCSACFIQSVTDDMDSILALAVKEGQLFKFGSGTGTNLSPLRGAMEGLSGGGKASGPVSFMKVYDSVAGIVKSGGKTRRAAKMQILDVDHPDIREFIWCKAREERKATDLILKAGYDSSFDGEAYGTVHFQNANLSVRVTDEFMEAAEANLPWHLTARTTGQILDSTDAASLLLSIAEAAWECGDPGIQFHDTINAWHTCPQDGPITASNPCSEYMFLPETACNLASLNLAAYLDENNEFVIEQFVADINDLVEVMDNIVDLAGYPTPEIAERSHRYRTLGLGFTNLGYALVKLGLAYDSPEARQWAQDVTALMHMAASKRSAELAAVRGAYPACTEAHLDVHRKHHYQLAFDTKGQSTIRSAATQLGFEALDLACEHGFRNAQMTVLAPTGTISFIMDCVTTGIEPLFARKMTKALAGGGTMELEFDDPHVRTADEVSPLDHLRMMAACQPFLSGAISKTVNVPNNYPAEQIAELYKAAHKMGLKAVAVYRDGCKLSQPLTTATEERQQNGSERHPLPSTRDAITHRFSVAGHTGYLTVGLYDDGRPGEIFVQVAREGSTISGLLDSWAITMSVALQHGVPLEALLDKLAYQRFEPAGMSDNTDIPMAHSIIDYIARWLILRFGEDDEEPKSSTTVDTYRTQDFVDRMPFLEQKLVEVFDRPNPLLHLCAVNTEEKTCPDCGGMLQRTGTCYSCPTCGYNGGCG
jgi:ribonucleoside-diphosphate reductase alpha chain